MFFYSEPEEGIPPRSPTARLVVRGCCEMPAKLAWESVTSRYAQLARARFAQRCGDPRRFQPAPGSLKAVFDSSTHIKNTPTKVGVFFMVPEEGIEPSIPCGPRILSPVRIPVPPPRRVAISSARSI